MRYFVAYRSCTIIAPSFTPQGEIDSREGATVWVAASSVGFLLLSAASLFLDTKAVHFLYVKLRDTITRAPPSYFWALGCRAGGV